MAFSYKVGITRQVSYRSILLGENNDFLSRGNYGNDILKNQRNS